MSLSNVFPIKITNQIFQLCFLSVVANVIYMSGHLLSMNKTIECKGHQIHYNLLRKPVTTKPNLSFIRVIKSFFIKRLYISGPNVSKKSLLMISFFIKKKHPQQKSHFIKCDIDYFNLRNVSIGLL